jgi:hypothetical protein
LAVAARPIPALERHFGVVDLDWERCVKAIGCLWSVNEARPIPAGFMAILDALIWLSPDQFRFGYLRLMESALQHSQHDTVMAAIEAAAEPVPRASVRPSAKFRAFAPDEYVLVRDGLNELKRRLKREELSEAAARIVDRAVRNWKRFADAAAGG